MKRYKYYILYSHSQNGAYIVKTDPEELTNLDWKPISNARERSWIKFVLDDYPIDTILYNASVNWAKELPLYRARWRRREWGMTTPV